jgi:putative restriction endonuclease
MTVNIPPLSILVVNQTGLPGSGFIAINSDYFEEGFQEVFEFFPKNPDNPFSFAADGTSYNDLLNSLLEEPEESLDVFAKVKVRGIAQTLFRDALIVAYENRCAFSDISFTETLEAAHIVPWSECDRGDRCNLRNGLLLSSLHHKLFDPNWITITEEYRIEFRDPKMIDGSYTASDKALVMALHRQKMLLPRDKRYWPDLRLIRNRNEKLGWKISTNQ